MSTNLQCIAQPLFQRELICPAEYQLFPSQQNHGVIAVAARMKFKDASGIDHCGAM